MVKETENHKTKHRMGGQAGGAVYGMGFVGALIFYLQNSANIMEGLLGVIKAIFWPAFLIYSLFGFLGMQ